MVEKTKPIPLFINASAGAFKNTQPPQIFAQEAEALDLSFDVIPTKSPQEMQRKLRELVQNKTPLVVVAGGDGTVSTAVQVLAHTETCLGIIPMGTANNFATALRLPLDLPSALHVIKDGEEQQVSLGKIGTSYFTETAGVGLFTNGLALTGNSHKLWDGVIALFKIIRNLQGNHLKLTLDDKLITQKVTMCTVANSFRMGYGMPIAPRARLTADTFEVIIFGPLKWYQLWRYFRAVFTQTHTSLPNVTSLQAKHVVIEARRHLKVHVDDSIIGTTPVEMVCEPKALRVLVDRL